MLSLAVAKKHLHPPQPLRGSSGLFIKTETYEPKKQNFDFNGNIKFEMAHDLLRRIDESFYTHGENNWENVHGTELISKIEEKVKEKKIPNKRHDPIKKLSEEEKEKSSIASEQMSPLSESPSKKSQKQAKSKSIDVEKLKLYKNSIPSGFEFDVLIEDDNSAFRCVAKHLFNDQNGHHSIRQKCVAHIRKNPIIFKSLNVNEDLEKYSKRMVVTNVKSDKTVLIFLAISYKFDLIVLKQKNFKMYQIYQSTKSTNEIFMYKTNDGHFHLLKRVDPECQIELIKMKPMQIKAATPSASLEENSDEDLSNFIESNTRKKSKSFCEKNQKPGIKISTIPNPNQLQRGKTSESPYKQVGITKNAQKPNATKNVNMSNSLKRKSNKSRQLNKEQEKPTNKSISNITESVREICITDISSSRKPHPIVSSGPIERWDCVRASASPESAPMVPESSSRARLSVTVTDAEPSNQSSIGPTPKISEQDKRPRNYNRGWRGNRQGGCHHNRDNRFDDGYNLLMPCRNPFCEMTDTMVIPVVPIIPPMGYGTYINPYVPDIGMYMTDNFEYATPGLYHVDRYPEDFYEPVPQPIDVTYPQRYKIPESMEERLREYKHPQLNNPPPQPNQQDMDDNSSAPIHPRYHNTLPDEPSQTVPLTDHIKQIRHYDNQ